MREKQPQLRNNQVKALTYGFPRGMAKDSLSRWIPFAGDAFKVCEYHGIWCLADQQPLKFHAASLACTTLEPRQTEPRLTPRA
jgi:hypothetical protein